MDGVVTWGGGGGQIVAKSCILHPNGAFYSMSTAIKVSESLADEARTAAQDADRSLTGQVEHWARLGKAIEPLLTTKAITALKKWPELTPEEEEVEKKRLLEALEEFRNTPASVLRERIGLEGQTLYEVDPEDSNRIIQVQPDGRRIHGRFVNRVFAEDTLES